MVCHRCMCSTHPFLQLRHCNCSGLGLGTSGYSVQVHRQVGHEGVEDLLRENFGKVVRNVESSGDVLDAEVTLTNPVCEPEISHVHTLGSLLV